MLDKQTEKPKRPFLKKNTHEHLAWGQGKFVCGIDEVGRGCFAGPVVTAAVMLPINTSYRLLKDSKEMSREEREQAARWIKRNCMYSYGIVHHRLIDKHNIWHATLIAMRRAVMNLFATASCRPDAIVVDAMPLKLQDSAYADIPVYHFPFGEKKSSSIAAASILAKVKRDEMMQQMDKYFPHYHWYANKGYGTKDHKDALRAYNHTIIHRVTYLKDFNCLTENQNHEPDYQQSLL